MKRAIVAVLCLFLCAAWIRGSPTGWYTLKGGGGSGGFLTGLDFSTDGTTFVTRTDTYGAYRWTGSSWTQLVNSVSMPSATVFPDYAVGTYEIAVAPSRPQRLYMIQRDANTTFGFFYSDNYGASWTQSGSWSIAYSSSYGQNAAPMKQYGRKIAVDPINPDVVYTTGITTGTSPLVSTDGGVSFASVSAITGATGNKGQIIAFDSSSAAIGGRTSKIYISSFGTGVYASDDAGVGWTLTPSTPTTHVHLAVAVDGIVYLTAETPSRLHKYTGGVAGTWSDISPNTTDTWQAIAVDPFHAERIAVNKSGGLIAVTENRGSSWMGPMNGSSGTWEGACAVGSPGNPSGLASNNRAATDIPWLGWSNECFMTTGDIRFDPAIENKLWMSEGIGIWYTTLTFGQVYTSTSQLTFTSQSAGIEQLVASTVMASAGCQPITNSHDRAVFYVTDLNTYPSTQAQDTTTQAPGLKYPLTQGFGMDWASTDPTFLVAIIGGGTSNNQSSSKSANCGQTWTNFTTMAASAVAGKLGGGIAAASTTNYVWSGLDNFNPAYTLDGGATWADADLSTWGVPKTGGGYNGETGFGAGPAAGFNRQTVAADRVTANTFYLYNSGMSSVAVSSMSWSGGTVTVTTPNHGMQTGTTPSVQILSASPSGYNGTYTVSVTSSTQFTYSLVSDPGAYVGSGRYAIQMFGLYKTTDGGVTWTRPYTSLLNGGTAATTGANSLLRSVPGRAGHLMFTAGQQSSSTVGPLLYSVNAGSTWTSITGITEPYSFGFGAIKPGNDYPSVYMIGYVGGTAIANYGVWRSDNSAAEWAANTVTWTRIGTWPLNSYDMPTMISGDMNNWGRAYIAWKGSGYAYYQPRKVAIDNRRRRRRRIEKAI